MELGQLAGRRHGAIPQNLQDIPKGFPEAVRGLKGHQGPGEGRDSREQPPSFSGLARQKAEENEAIRWEPRGHQGRHRGGGSGDRHHREAPIQRGADQRKARIRKAGHPGLRNQRHVAPGQGL